jgi:predicted Zn-dependent peptidase
MTPRPRRASLAMAAILTIMNASVAAPAQAAIAAASDTPPASGAASLKVQFPPSRETVLPNGARIILAEKHDVPMIAFTGYIVGGSLTDPPGKEGVASITAEMLRKGAGRRSAREIAAVADGVGADLSTGSGLEVSYIAGNFMARDDKLMLDLIRSLLREPTFPDSEFTKLKAQTIEALRAEKDDPSSMLSAYAAAYFYGSHPYGRPADGDEQTVAGITREDVLASYRANYGGDRLVLAMVGDFDAKAMESRLRSALGDWGKAGTAPPRIEPASKRTGRRVFLIDKPDATQSYFWMGNLGVKLTDPDRVSIDVVNTAFGGRFTSMLNTALRIKSGLTYGARSRLSRLQQPGTAAIVSYTKLESTEKAIDLALETLARLHSAGIDDTTLRSATRYIAGQYPTAYERSGQIAGALVELATHDLPLTEVTEYPTRISAVQNAAALRPVIDRVYPQDKNLTIVVVGPAASLRKALAKYGPIVETSIEQPLLAGTHSARPSAAH